MLVKSWPDEKNRQVYGKCFNLHGHSYKLHLSLSGNPDESGMIIHFSDLKEFINGKIISKFDHAYLNDLEEFHELPTTVENIALVIAEIFKLNWPYPGVTLRKITLFETEKSSCTLELLT